MNVIAVSGIKGGVGTTTVTAHIAAGLAEFNRDVLVIDMSQYNHLGLYFGLPWEETRGLTTQLLSDLPWRDACYRSHNGIYLIPFGNPERAQQQASPCLLPSHFERIAGEFPQLALNEGWIILDCPLYEVSDVWRESLLNHCNVVLRVVNADALNYSMMMHSQEANELQLPASPDTETAATSQVLQKERFLINRYCPAMNLERDVHALMQSDFEDSLAPLLIHRDENIREALAYKQTVFDCAPTSQACQDFHLLASWLIAGENSGWVQ